MTIEETRRFFDAIARRYDRVYAPPREGLARLVEILGPPGRVLDLGVGTGRELSVLLDRGHQVTGVECSAEMIARCNQRARRIPIERCDLWEPLPFATASFDAVISLFGTLAHPPDGDAPTRLAREVRRVLVPSGAFVFEVPTPRWIASLPSALPSGDLAIARTGECTARHEDRVANASIEIVAMQDREWKEALEGFDVTVERIGDFEARFTARSRPSPGAR
jgi:SAM-dependent methyltransferase